MIRSKSPTLIQAINVPKGAPNSKVPPKCPNWTYRVNILRLFDQVQWTNKQFWGCYRIQAPKVSPKCLESAPQMPRKYALLPQSVPTFKKTELIELIFLYLVDQDHSGSKKYPKDAPKVLPKITRKCFQKCLHRGLLSKNFLNSPRSS